MNRVSVILFWLLVFALAALASGRISFPTSAKFDPSYGPHGTRALATAKYDQNVQQSVDSLLERIEKSSVAIVPDQPASNWKSLTDTGLEQLESDLGYAIPGELKAFLKSEHLGRIPWQKIWSDWYVHGADDIHQWSIGEYLSWCVHPGTNIPSADSCEYGPGMVLFISNDYEFFAAHIETGGVWIIDPESGFEYQASGMLAWLEKTATRLENGEFVNNEDEFLFIKKDKQTANSPGGGE